MAQTTLDLFLAKVGKHIEVNDAQGERDDVAVITGTLVENDTVLICTQLRDYLVPLAELAAYIANPDHDILTDVPGITLS